MSNPREKWYESDGIKQQRKKSLWRILCAWKLQDQSFKFITSQKPFRFFFVLFFVVHTLEYWRNHICDVDNIGQWINKAGSHELHQYVRTKRQYRKLWIQDTVKAQLFSWTPFNCPSVTFFCLHLNKGKATILGWCLM